MEEGLFKKYIVNIEKQKNSKQEIIKYIQEESGVLLKENEVVLSKKEVKLNISSVTKHKLWKKSIQTLLSKKGYQLKI